MLLIIGELIVPRLANKIPEGNVSSPGGEILECSSAKELSKTIGFEVSDIEDVPFEIETKSYISYWNDFSEIEYTGGEKNLVYRKSPGTGDISGIFEEYKDITEIKDDNSNVTLKGNDELYYLALWEKDGYSYSVYINFGMEEKDFAAIINNIK